MQAIRRFIAAVQTTAITKKMCRKIGIYCGGHLNTATTYIWWRFYIPLLQYPANVIFIAAGFLSAAISKFNAAKTHIAAILYTTVVVCRKRLELLRRSNGTPQYVTYSGSFCTRCKKPSTIARFSCSALDMMTINMTIEFIF